jgi:hypothetical protein
MLHKMFVYLLALWSLTISSVNSFSITQGSRKFYVDRLVMSNDLQELGKRVPVRNGAYKIQPPVQRTTKFGESSVAGAGMDERFASVDYSQYERDANTLSKVHLSYRRYSLLQKLSSDILSYPDKLSIVSSAVSYDYLPNHISPVNIQPDNFLSGGLMSDWASDMA